MGSYAADKIKVQVQSRLFRQTFKSAKYGNENV